MTTDVRGITVASSRDPRARFRGRRGGRDLRER